MNAQSLCGSLYKTESVRGNPEVYRVELEIGSDGLDTLERLSASRYGD